MILCLSLVSAQGVWALLSDDATQLVDSESWTDTDSTGLSAGLGAALDRLSARSLPTLASVTRIGVVSGPGAFTGLRIASAYAQGLHRSIGARLFAIPTFHLIGRSFYLPMQHQKARHLDLAGFRASAMECLQVRGPSPNDVSMQKPAAEETDALVLGLQDTPAWPSPAQVHTAALTTLRAHPPEGLHIQYGLEPKISGQRPA